jgi:cation-transporting ATPase E
VLGAPELFSCGELAAVAAQEADAGRRVVALGESRNGLSATSLSGEVRVVGLAVLGEQLRPEARETVEFFRRQGVELKVLSGDRPETVAAIAADVGIPADRVLDGRELPESPAGLAALLRTTAVIGRTSPES